MATATFKFGPPAYPSSLGSVDQETITFSGSISFSAATDTYATGGLLALAGFAALNLGPYADRTPLFCSVQSLSGSGWNYQYNPTTKKLQIFATAVGSGTAAPGELTNGTALNAATPNIFTDTVVYTITFPRH